MQSDQVSLKTRVGRMVRANPLYWRYAANFEGWKRYKLSRHPLSKAQRSVIIRLRRDGIALTSVDELLSSPMLFEELSIEADRLSLDLSPKITDVRENAANPDYKSYLLKYLDEPVLLDPESIFVRFALQPEVLAIANGYFGLLTRLIEYNAWHNFPSGPTARNSQLWHRDPEDRFILKMFVYLSDVGEEAGPLHYACGTHGYGQVKQLPESCAEEGTTTRRSNDEQMCRVVPVTNWVRAIGPRATIAFADTRGYHKGGHAQSKERLLYECIFTSRGSSGGEYFKRNGKISF